MPIANRVCADRVFANRVPTVRGVPSKCQVCAKPTVHQTCIGRATVFYQIAIFPIYFL